MRERHQGLRLAAPLLLACAVPAPPCAAQELAELVRTAEAMNVRTGVAVADLDTGTSCYVHRAGELFVPASNQKILTVAAVLQALGADYRFKTAFQVREGELVAVAGGDPSWITGAESDPRTQFERVARQLRAAGIAELRGVRLDLGPFTGPSRPAGWPADQLTRAYCAPTGGLVLDGACIAVRIDPTAGGATARVEVVAPPIALPVRGSIELTSDRRKGGRFRVDLIDGEIRIDGHYLRRAPARDVRIAVSDPEAIFRAALVESLAHAGIAVGAGGHGDSDRSPGERALLEVSTEVTRSLRRALKDSSNFDAEQCLRVLGAERAGDGSFAGGLRALRQALDELCGPIPAGICFADGSGLSRDNRLSPEFTVHVLSAALRSDDASLFLDALAQSGVDGTLERRFRGTDLAGRVRAKTGTINGVSSLSGVVQDESGRLVVFSILMNYERKARGPSLHGLQEQMVQAIARLGG